MLFFLCVGGGIRVHVSSSEAANLFNLLYRYVAAITILCVYIYLETSTPLHFINVIFAICMRCAIEDPLLL